MLTISAIGAVALPGRSMAMTMEERMEAMELKMSQLTSKLEHAEAENQQLKRYLTASDIKIVNPDSHTIKNVDDKLTMLEKRMDFDKSASEEAAKKKPKLDITSKGVSFKSADENYKLNLRGYAQADTNVFLDNSAITDKFTLRRARLTLDGTLFKNIDFRIAPDFANSQLRLFDAFVDLHYFPGASLMAGKFRQPVSLERMQTAPNLTFVERAYPAMMAPNRDIGVMLHGAVSYPGYKVQYSPQPVFKEFLGYEMGIFNGIRDNQAVQNSDTEQDNNKELAARLFMHPFLHSGSPLEGLGIGIAGTWGRPKNNALSSLVSPGQQTILSYNAATATSTVTSSGDAHRIYPQMYWYHGPFGILGEYLLSSQQLHGTRTGATNINVSTRQNNTAWQANFSYMLTGEDNSFFGIKPERVFDPAAGTWGAFQIAARWSEMNIDGSTFRNYGSIASPFYLSNPASSIRKAQSWALGLNWFLNDNAKIMANYEQTYFSGGAANSSGGIINRQMEKVFLTRFQFAF